MRPTRYWPSGDQAGLLRSRNFSCVTGCGLRAVALHHPEVVAAAAVAREGDGLPVRAVARLEVPGHAVGERLRLAAGDGQGVEVTEQVEDELISAWAHVHAHPRALGDVDGYVGGGHVRSVDVPVGGARVRGTRGRRRRARVHLGGLGGLASGVLLRRRLRLLIEPVSGWSLRAGGEHHAGHEEDAAQQRQQSVHRVVLGVRAARILACTPCHPKRRATLWSSVKHYQ